MPPFKFEISLTVLNHLGRNLYRSFATVIGEAISNAWDAEAENVSIAYDANNRKMSIRDDGFGMSREDLQNKFLKIGYSKRESFGFNSPNKKRPHIGRKGIGKLALLSCSSKVVVLSKSSGDEWHGVVIDNSELREEIEKDSSVDSYELAEADLDVYKDLCIGEKGTVIYFEGLEGERGQSLEFLKKIIALYFRFSLFDPNFKIFVNEEMVTSDALGELFSNTQFVWNINGHDKDPFLDILNKTCPVTKIDTDNKQIRGFIASVKKPMNRNIFGAKDRIGVDLFVNGRVREVDILKHAPSSRVPEEYLYGQIHINSLDSVKEIDHFTSSREGVQIDDPTIRKYFEEIREIVQKIINQWNDLRDQAGDDGDPDNTTRETSKIKKAKSLHREVAKDFNEVSSKQNEKYLRGLEDDAAFNNSSYAQCFISENLLRRHIEDNSLRPNACSRLDSNGKSCIDKKNENNGRWDLCVYCGGEYNKANSHKLKSEAKTSIQIRHDENDNLMYMDYLDLANIIKDSILSKEERRYKPVRNAVMHTSRLTEDAKIELTSIFNNIVATINKLARNEDKEKNSKQL